MIKVQTLITMGKKMPTEVFRVTTTMYYSLQFNPQLKRILGGRIGGEFQRQNLLCPYKIGNLELDRPIFLLGKSQLLMFKYEHMEVVLGFLLVLESSRKQWI